MGVALLVMLARLTPGERVAFVLHDSFGLSFEEIARILERTPAAVRQLASRGRRRVRGVAPSTEAGTTQNLTLARTYLAAARAGDFQGLLALLAPDVVMRADAFAAVAGVPPELRGAEAVAQRALLARAQHAQVALLDGAPGVVSAPGGRLRFAFRLAFAQGRIQTIEFIADPAQLQTLVLTLPEG